MDSATLVLNNSSNIDANIRNSVRYMLVHKMMEENFTKWLSQSSTMNLVQKLIDDCKKPNISLSTPSPIFVTKVNSLTTSQTINQQFSFMPPVSPNSSSLINYQNEKKNLLTESQILKEEKKKLSESTTGSSLLQSMDNKNKLPKFYFPIGNLMQEELDLEDKIIYSVFIKEEVTIEEFLPITVELLGFPKLLNSVVYKKMLTEGKEKVNKSNFIKFHKEHFQGKNEYRKFFNLIKNPNSSEDVLLRSDFMPFMKCFLEYHPGLEFLKAHPDFQDKYGSTVVMRIFYILDLNDDGKINYREYRKSNILHVFKKVCEEPDINKIRDYFSYEHFYVLYCLFWDLDGNEHDFLIDKEEFSKYDGHSLSRKAVDRIFAQIPRKFKSGVTDKMGFEDFMWYLLSEEDKTTRTSIDYWFRVVDLDNNGIITPHEMQYFYDEQTHRMQYLDHETVNFNDIVCQLYDNIKPDKEHQFTLENFLTNKLYSSAFFNNLLNLHKFIAHEQKDPFSRTEIDKNPDFSDWDKFAFYEYQRLTSEDSDDQQEANDSGLFDSTDNTNAHSDADDLIASVSGNEY